MERLTERFHAKGDKPTILHHGHRWGPAFFPNKDGYKQYSALLDKLAAYEDAEEQGQLIVLPCKIGEKIFRIRSTRGCENCKKKNGVCSGNDCPAPDIVENKFRYEHLNCIEDIYPTHEAAENALKAHA